MTSEELQKAYTQYVNNMGNNGAGALMPYNQEFASQFGQQQPYQYYYPTATSFVPPVAPAAPTPPPAVPATALVPVVYACQDASCVTSHTTRGSEKSAVVCYGARWRQSGRSSTPPPPAVTNLMAATAQATTGSVAPASSCRSFSGGVFEGRKSECYRYYEYEYPPPAKPEPSPPPTEKPSAAAPPILLCHTCSVCGKMRSARFHRANPIIPGRPTIQGVCRRCTKKDVKDQEEEEHEAHESTRRRFIHTRKCTADEPCDWPDRGRGRSSSVHIRFRSREPRDRRRDESCDSEEIIVERRPRSISPPRVIRRKESRHRNLLGLLQLDKSSPPPTSRRRTEVRYASPSPPRRESLREMRIRTRIRCADDEPPPPLECAAGTPMEEPLPRPPMKLRARSISPQPYRVSYFHDAEHKLASHPAPYRPVAPDTRRSCLQGSSNDYLDPTVPPLPPPLSATQGLLRGSGYDREITYRRRATLNGQENTVPEVGGSRVQFVPANSSSPRSKPPPSSTHPRIEELPDDGESHHFKFRARRHDEDGDHSENDYIDYYHRRGPPARKYVDEEPEMPRSSQRDPPPPPSRPVPVRSSSPPIREFEEFRVRRVASPPGPPPRGRAASRGRDYIPLDYRHVRVVEGSPPPAPRPATPPTPPRGRRVRVSHRSVSGPAAGYEHPPSPPLVPPPPSSRNAPPPEKEYGYGRSAPQSKAPQRPGTVRKDEEWEEVTATDSGDEKEKEDWKDGDVIEVTTWRKFDEREGRWRTWVEERKARDV